MYFYYQVSGGEERWRACPEAYKAKITTEENPTFFTVLAVSKLVEDLPYEEKQKLKYSGPFYADWDGPDIALVAAQFNAFLNKLETMRFDLRMANLYATGGKGFHLEIPAACFMEKVPKDGVQSLPTIYREMALELYVDSLDMRVYSQGAGRMWRCPNKLRANGKHKVGLTVSEARAITPESYNDLCSSPRNPIIPAPAALCVDLALTYARAEQKVEEKIKKRGKSKPDPHVKQKALGPSIGLMMMGEGIKPGTGFQYLALQLAIAATTAGTPIDQFIEQCAGLIEKHESDGNRYDTPAKREQELRRMYNYTDGNPMYEFSIGAIKSLLTHTAPDLDGITVDQEDIVDSIKEAAEESLEPAEPDEYADVAAQITLNKYGIYAATEEGKKRICAVSFTDTNLLISCESGQIVMYETSILVNGKTKMRQSLETDVFASVPNFNRFCATLGHAFSGSDLQLRSTFMRFIEQAKKKGGVQYVTKREGLDVITIPNHENPALREPFLVWSDNRGVLLDPRASKTELQMQFKGFPDPRGSYRTDIADAPKLAEWIKVPENKAALKRSLTGLFSCQQPDTLAKLLGWYTACFWRMLFHKAYDKFPLLHIVGAAGSGKTEMNLAMLSLFYYNSEPKALTPGSSQFAIMQHLAGSASIPLMLDEYKPHEMTRELHNKMKLMLRDTYNCRDVMKGGGTRENDDYRSLHNTQQSAPLLFISEATEDEAAVMERVLWVNIVKPAASVAVRRAALFDVFRRNKQHLSILGQYIAGTTLMEYTVDKLREEFDPLYEAARKKFMMTEADEKAGLSQDELSVKQNAKERTVFNYTVGLFGFQKFREIVNLALDDALDPMMSHMETGIYDKMAELQKTTQAEYLKVLAMLSSMTYSVEDTRAEAIRYGQEYAFSTYGGKDVLELSARTAYIKYRMFCRSSSMNALFPGHESFVMALKDSPATLKQGMGSKLMAPGVFTMDIDELARLGVDAFKPHR